MCADGSEHFNRCRAISRIIDPAQGIAVRVLGGKAQMQITQRRMPESDRYGINTLICPFDLVFGDNRQHALPRFTAESERGRRLAVLDQPLPDAALRRVQPKDRGGGVSVHQNAAINALVTVEFYSHSIVLDGWLVND